MTDIFVGFFYDDEKATQLLKDSPKGISAAANQYQKGFLEGLSNNAHIITTISTGTFPKRNKRLLFKREEKSYGNGKILYLPFINLHFIREWMFKVGLYSALDKMIRKQEKTTVYVYSLNVVFEKVMARLKRKYGESLHYCLIVPDLPGQYGLVRSGIKGIKDRMDAKPKMQLAAFADSFVFLTEAMKELFPQKPYRVIEGFLPTEAFDYHAKRIPKTILYTGTLAAPYGIQMLLEAFAKLKDPEYQLWICGSGGVENQIRLAAKDDPRIRFMGFLPKKEIAALQTQCDVLINPRPAEGIYTKYSFPSKTMEYLLSGSKVVMYRLPGIGEEYYRFIRVIEAVDAETMAQAIVNACNDNGFYAEQWKKQIEWICNAKQAETQVQGLKRIIEAE